MFCLLSLVLEIGFEQAEYFVGEGQAFAEVVLTKLGENERPVSVILSTRNGAATGTVYISTDV